MRESIPARSLPAYRLILLLPLLLAALVALPRAGAQQPPRPAPAPETEKIYAPVRVEGRTLFEVAGTEELSAAERADRISRRLTNLIAREEPVAPFTAADVRTRGGRPLITLGGEPIMEVTAEDAEDSLATQEELALLWGGKMGAAVADARAVRQNPLRGAGILIRNSVRDLFTATVRWLPRLGSALLLLVIFWLLAKALTWLVRVVAQRARVDDNLRQLARAFAFYGTWALGLIAVLSALGLETGAVVAALGISGFILGFAFQDILSHFLAGLMLLLGRQFRIGDQIVVKEYEGTVERIELRALHLRTYDNRLVIIPNGDVFTSAVVSNTASPYRRRDFIVGIGYGDDVERARELALRTVRETEGVLADPAPDVLVDELAASTVNLRIRFYMNSLRADYLRVGSDCMRRVKEAFDREGISMPTEIQTLVIENVEALARALRPRTQEGEAAGESGAPTRRAA